MSWTEPPFCSAADQPNPYQIHSIVVLSSLIIMCAETDSLVSISLSEEKFVPLHPLEFQSLRGQMSCPSSHQLNPESIILFFLFEITEYKIYHLYILFNMTRFELS
uniref:Uncharacterized protein n=1 Tax=Arion vulgaris TaxID=1028688 RepID=A0A0B7BDI5_9EUPU